MTPGMLEEHGMSEVLDDYSPSEDEEYMSEQQLAYFRAKLLAWKHVNFLLSSPFWANYLQAKNERWQQDRVLKKLLSIAELTV